MKTHYKKSAPIYFLLAAFLLAGCGNPEKKTTAFDLEEARKEIDEANRQFSEFYYTGDSVALANMFALDAKSLLPNGPAVSGRKDIQAHYSRIKTAGATKLELTTTGLWGNEALLAEEGLFKFRSSDGNLYDEGKYIVLWKKEDGSWKLFRDCYNSDWPIQLVD